MGSARTKPVSTDELIAADFKQLQAIFQEAKTEGGAELCKEIANRETIQSPFLSYTLALRRSECDSIVDLLIENKAELNPDVDFQNLLPIAQLRFFDTKHGEPALYAKLLQAGALSLSEEKMEHSDLYTALRSRNQAFAKILIMDYEFEVEDNDALNLLEDDVSTYRDRYNDYRQTRRTLVNFIIEKNTPLYTPLRDLILSYCGLFKLPPLPHEQPEATQKLKRRKTF